MTHKEILESFKTIRVAHKDHHHFTNWCPICVRFEEDDIMVAVTIVRNGYIERDYVCAYCLHEENIISAEELKGYV